MRAFARGCEASRPRAHEEADCAGMDVDTPTLQDGVNTPIPIGAVRIFNTHSMRTLNSSLHCAVFKGYRPIQAS